MLGSRKRERKTDVPGYEMSRTGRNHEYGRKLTILKFLNDLFELHLLCNLYCNYSVKHLFSIGSITM